MLEIGWDENEVFVVISGVDGGERLQTAIGFGKE
jgi:hypothetical protein